MNFKEYEKEVEALAFVKDKEVPPYVYAALGLSGEVGEMMEELKKSIRETDGTTIPANRLAKLRLEAGDVLWYLTHLVNVLGFDLEDVAKANIEKLKTRQGKGK